MVRSTKQRSYWEHCVAIQKNRVARGKPGWAKAVRRALKRIHTHPNTGRIEWDDYHLDKQALPVLPIPVKEEKDPYAK